MGKRKIVVHSEQELSFSSLEARFKFPNLFLHFPNILKRFLAALLSDTKCLLQHYSDFDFSWPIKA